MFQFFTIFLIIVYVVNLFKKQRLLLNLINKVIVYLLVFYFILTSYYGSKFFYTLIPIYNYSQLINYLYINLFNVNWTNLYLLVLVTIVYFIFIFHLNTFNFNYLILMNKFIIFSLCLIIYSFLKNFSEMYLICIEKISFFSNFIPDVNALLLNNLVLIHPIFTHFLYGYFIFYSLYYIFLEILYNKQALILCKIKIQKFFSLPQNYFYNFQYFSIFKQNYVFLIVSYLTILLGSIWAAQELVWNSWWNWDIIEIIAFGFFIILVFFLHFFKKKNFFLKIYNYSIENIIVFILFYFFIRLDISASLHSFNLFDAIEIYLYLFYILFISVLYFLFFKKLNFLKSYKHNTLMKQFKKYDYIIIFFKFLLTSLYFYCFLIWFNDSEGYVIKNEIVWLYSILYKYLLLLIYIIYYFFIFKINWVIIGLVTINFVLYIIVYKFYKNIYKFYKNIYVVLHLLIFLFIIFTIIDNFVQIYSYNINSISTNFINNFILNKKIIIYYWNNFNKWVDINLLLNNYLILKQDYNSFLLFKQNYLVLNSFNLIIWQEQSYNYYLNTDILNTTLTNLYYKENNNVIIINKTTHYLYSCFIFLTILIMNYKKIKKQKILIFF